MHKEPRCPKCGRKVAQLHEGGYYCQRCHKVLSAGEVTNDKNSIHYG